MKTKLLGLWLFASLFVFLSTNTFALSVSTADIVDGAVTTAKLANGAVTGPKLGVGAVGGTNIAAGAVGSTALASGAVTSDSIADGAVTNAKIYGQITADKILSVGLNADTIDGKHASDLSPAVHSHSASDIISGSLSPDRISTYKYVKVVHKGPADNVNTFNSISSAIAAVGYDQSHRSAILVMNGNYVENIDTIQTGYANFDIIGQSIDGTIISPISEPVTLNYLTNISNLTVDGTNYTGWALTLGAVCKAKDLKIITKSCGMIVGGLYYDSDGIEIDRITIINKSTSTDGTAIVANISGDTKASLTFNDIDIKGKFEHGITFSASYYAGEMRYQKPIIINNSSINVESYGIWSYGSLDVILNNVFIEESNIYGKSLMTTSYSASPTGKNYLQCNNCTLKGDVISNGDIDINNSIITKDIRIDNDGGPAQNIMKLANSQIGGSFIITSINSTAKLVNCHDNNYDAIPNGILEKNY